MGQNDGVLFRDMVGIERCPLVNVPQGLKPPHTSTYMYICM